MLDNIPDTVISAEQRGVHASEYVGRVHGHFAKTRRYASFRKRLRASRCYQRIGRNNESLSTHHATPLLRFHPWILAEIGDFSGSFH